MMNFPGAAEPFDTTSMLHNSDGLCYDTAEEAKVEDADQLVDVGYGSDRFCPLLIWISAPCVMD